ncbi:MAG TPA: transcriptional regulator NrdR [Polyangiaceae bacterium]|nr:transcriptional regulator NrdR [Polyangiaceae bacterium]
MKCPYCGHLDSSVIDSRVSATSELIRRRRSCDKCERRFTTYERVDEIWPTIVKKDGRRERFDRQKLINGLRASCNKRPVSVEQIDGIADAIERDLQDRDDKEIASSLIGEQVMARLREADEVAYVRFASVYRSFRDIDEFMAELGKLVKARDPH